MKAGPLEFTYRPGVVSTEPRAQASGGCTLSFATFPAIEFLDYKQQTRVFDDVMGVAISRALWTTGAAPESVNAPLVTPNAFQFLGVPALLGRFQHPQVCGRILLPRAL